MKESQGSEDPFESYEAFVNGLGDWKEPLAEFLKKDTMKKIFEYVKKAYSAGTCYPPKHQIFNAF